MGLHMAGWSNSDITWHMMQTDGIAVWCWIQWIHEGTHTHYENSYGHRNMTLQNLESAPCLSGGLLVSCLILKLLLTPKQRWLCLEWCWNQEAWTGDEWSCSAMNLTSVLWLISTVFMCRSFEGKGPILPLVERCYSIHHSEGSHRITLEFTSGGESEDPNSTALHHPRLTTPDRAPGTLPWCRSSCGQPAEHLSAGSRGSFPTDLLQEMVQQLYDSVLHWITACIQSIVGTTPYSHWTNSDLIM